MSRLVAEAELPTGVLLERYRTENGHVDCYVAEIARDVDLSAFITAFYTSRAFRPERWLLGVLLKKRASNSDVARLAAGTTDRFSAWTVEARREDEFLLCDFRGRTRSWLMVRAAGLNTRLYFGSAVIPATNRVDRSVFSLLLGFHRWYSRRLLAGAVTRLLR